MEDIRKELYKIYDVKFKPLEFQKKVDKIVELFINYNRYLDNSPFDTQFLSMQLLKYEARHSNMIEGLDTNDVELLAQDTPTSKKISNYVNALKNANLAIKNNKLFTEELILNIHRDLFQNMMSVHAINAIPGMWRIKQVKIANYYPPKPQDVPIYMNDFVNWLNDNKGFEGCNKVLEALVKGAIAHAYFEKIHPFTDGNGRTGRILFNLIINKYDLSTKPYFYISKGILKDQFTYYQELAKLDNSCDFQKWIDFFLDLLVYQLESNIKTFSEAIKLIVRIRNEIIKEENPRYRELKKTIFEYISKYPIFTFSRVYFKCKPKFDDIDDATFVGIFNILLEQCEVKKVADSKHYEFKKIVDIIVGKKW
ncbi:Fic family protein [Spiroplasma tabanidicola]|uniref:Fic family protein n=1 Tax=Spiroplasma tabanidicola TaxID=324079 RepID=A0A6I6C653_9MOLU|nr:Fic family protein [Spiroplasma tabanidicola]QGS51630.1 Fic family protein [Spiroplasma tabanidicola]